METYAKPKQWKQEKIERLREEGDHIKFIHWVWLNIFFEKKQ